MSFYDIPDVARLSVRYELPFGVGKPRMNRGATAVYFSWENGTPVAGPNDSNSEDGGLYFHPAAFSRVPQFPFGNGSRNVPDVRIPGNKNWDLLIEKRISFTERIALDFRTELFHGFNNVVFNGPQTNVTSADFGRIRLLQANIPRQIQFGLRLSY